MGLGQWRAGKIREQGLHERRLFHLTLIDNLPSIIEHGLLPRAEAKKRGFSDISMEAVQDRRSDKSVNLGPDGSGTPVYKNLHELVPFYFTPRNPMTYVRRERIDELCFLSLPILKLCRDDMRVAFSDGNAASESTEFLYSVSRLGDHVSWGVIDSDRWDDKPDGRRQRCAEFLVSPKVEFELISRVVVASATGRNRVADALRVSGASRPIEVDGNAFFDSPAEAFYREPGGVFTPLVSRRGSEPPGEEEEPEEEPF